MTLIRPEQPRSVPISALIFREPRNTGVGRQQDQRRRCWLNLGGRVHGQHLLQRIIEGLPELPDALDFGAELHLERFPWNLGAPGQRIEAPRQPTVNIQCHRALP